MKTVEVVAAIINKDNKYLITKRSYGEFKDMWEFPGGKIELGESKEEALHREIEEELEITIKDLEFLTTVDYDYQSFHLTMHCYLCKISGGHLKLKVHNAIKWLALNELDNQLWVPADVHIIEILKLKETSSK